MGPLNTGRRRDRPRSRVTPVHVLAAAAILALLVMPVAFAGVGDPGATKSASLTKQIKKLKRRVAALEAKPDQVGQVPASLPPSGPAGGDLTGTYPNPELKPGVVGTAETGTIPAARVTNSGAESIPSGLSETTLTFDSEDYDNASLHSTSANSSRLTAPIAGIYDVVGQAGWTLNPSGFRELQLIKNGVQPAALSVIAPSTSVTDQEVTSQIALGAGDYVELQVLQDSGGALNVTSHSDFTPVLSMHWVGP